MQPAQIIYEGNSQQSSLAKSSNEEIVALSSSSDEQFPCTSFHASSSSTSRLKRKFPFSFSLHSTDISSDGNSTDSEELPIPLGVAIEDCAALLKTELEKIPALEDEIKDVIDAEAAEATPLESSERIGDQQTQPVLPQVNIEDLQSKNPLFILLRKSGLHCQKLIDDPHRNDLVPEWRDINFIAKVTAKHLLNLAIPPKCKISPSTLIRWTEYFNRLFPKTPTSCFYAFKYEPSKRRNGIIIKKKRAEGALQVQLFQERRKLIKEDRTVMLRRPSADSIDGDRASGPLNVPIITSTWRLAGQQGEEVQHRDEISTTGNFSLIFSHNKINITKLFL